MSLTPADAGGSMSGVSDVTYDTVIRNGRWFDGTGAPSAVRTIGIRDGHVAAVVTGDLDETGAQVIDATDQWVLPGMIDIHTHYDVEVLGGPALSESLRHGVTTVLLGSCSLSTVYLDAADADHPVGLLQRAVGLHLVGRDAGGVQATDDIALVIDGAGVAANAKLVRTGERGRACANQGDALAGVLASLEEALDPFPEDWPRFDERALRRLCFRMLPLLNSEQRARLVALADLAGGPRAVVVHEELELLQ